MCHTRFLIIFVVVVVIEAYKSKRDISFFNGDITSYRKPHSQNFFFDQLFIEQQNSPTIAVRDQITNQQTLHNLPLKGHITYPPAELPIHRHKPFEQNSFRVTSFKDKPLFREAILGNQKLRGEREILRDNPFIEQSFTSDEIFDRQASTYKSQTPFKEQLFIENPLNLHYEQLPSSEQTSFQKQTAFAEYPSISNSIKLDQDESYNKLIDLYGRHKNIQTLSNKGGFSMYTKHDNHAFELSSMPTVSPFKHFSPSNIEMPRTLPSASIHGPDFSMSPIPSSVDEIYSSEAIKMKFRPMPITESTMSLSGSNCNAPIDSSPTTVPSISVSTNQSSIVGHILTSLTTKPSSPVMDTTSIAPFVENTVEPIHFYATKHGAVLASSLPTQNELKSNIHAFLNMPKNSFKINENKFKFPIPDASKNNIKTNTQSPTLGYFSEEYKTGLKSIQNSFVNYALPEGFKYGWPLQQFSQPEMSIVPLSLNGNTKFVLSNMSTTPIPIISWPMETSSDFAPMMPLKLTVSHTAINNNIPQLPSVNLPLDSMTSIPNSLTPSISNTISGSITGGISTGIPSGMMADMPASIPTLNLEQSLHRIEQLQQTQEARNPWYPTGILAIR
ncbi:uncharacterized protein LOC114930561 [Nylanderia fulva]|uniref:uncharacterized protein LOC114930561 n=1 Tax=Nylanderia fulva TaxID=613905 RepID=UPI0010FB312E|nr:uncharacterized protein LOC114930561 [Nylanderia fulva]